jgi:uncharacterized protein YndB with AHSA1/START domain
MPDILHLLTIQAPPEKVYQALTTPAGIRSWWTREAELEAWIGGRGEFRFYGGKGVTEVRVEVLEPPLRVGWRVTAANAPGGWEGTTITFDLAEKDGGTLLSFAQRGFARADEGFALVTTGWAYYLVSLQQYLERGKGTPQQDKDFSILAAPRADEARSAPSSPEIRHELGIKASPAAVYEALTDVRKLGQWWIPDTRGESKTGKSLEFWFGESACQTMEVRDLQADRLVRWAPTEKGMADWRGTEIEFAISPIADGSSLHFRHSNWRDSEGCFAYCSLSWAVFLLSLRDLLEKGEGYPFPNQWIGR